jgi:hypothetical protein
MEAADEHTTRQTKQSLLCIQYVVVQLTEEIQIST